MSDISIDCKGLPCPQPVIQCKNTLESDAPETISIAVDNEPAKENVSRFLGTKGYTVSTQQIGDDYIITGTRTEDATCEVCEVMSEADLKNLDQHNILVFLASDVIGSGDDELGGNLMFNFISTLKELGSDLWRIIMVNSAVKLAVEDGRCIEELKKLEENGVSILVCGTCLEFFKLTDKKAVGEVTNMLDVVTSFQLATKTIRV